MGGTRKVQDRCMEGVWEVRRRCTGGVRRVCPGVSFQLIR